MFIDHQWRFPFKRFFSFFFFKKKGFACQGQSWHARQESVAKKKSGLKVYSSMTPYILYITSYIDKKSYPQCGVWTNICAQIDKMYLQKLEPCTTLTYYHPSNHLNQSEMAAEQPYNTNIQTDIYIHLYINLQHGASIQTWKK